MKEADINKTAIISRLKAYRERNGARAYRIVAHYVGSKRISDDVLRAIVSNAYRISDEAWMRIDATLDDLEKKEAMKHENKLVDLNNHLFAELERLSDEDLQGDELTAEIDRAKAITGVASQIIANGTLALKARVIADNSLSADFTVPAMLED